MVASGAWAATVKAAPPRASYTSGLFQVVVQGATTMTTETSDSARIVAEQDVAGTADTAAVGAAGEAIGSKLWSMANTLRAAGVRPADYQGHILPVLMHKVVCDRVAAKRDEVVAEHGEEFWGDFSEDLAPFTLPPGTSFDELAGVDANIGERLTDALVSIQEANTTLAGVFLGTDYAKLPDQAVTDLLRVLGEVSFSPAETAEDALGQAYEYLLGKFADAAGAKAGQFFTPGPVARLLVRLVDPQPGESVYDPACGSGGLLNAAAEQVADAGHDRKAIALFGQELDEQSHAIATVNMLLHGNAGSIRRGDTLLDPKFTTDDSLERWECSVANPPFGLTNTAHGTWSTDRFGRFAWGTPPRKPAELAFVAHIAHSLRGAAEGEAKTGRAAIVLPMGALFRGGKEAEIRERLLDADLVDSVIALPVNLFYNTSIPAAILVLRTKSRHAGKVLFVDATQAFEKAKKQNTLTDEHVDLISKAAEICEGVGCVRAKLVAAEDVATADADLSVARWMPAEQAALADVPRALYALRETEQAASQAAMTFWSHVEAAGYDLH